MNPKPVTGITFYRYRYAIVYTVLIVLATVLLTLNISSLPPGISQAEESSVLTSSRINLHATLPTLGKDALTFLQQTNAVNLPYHLLQKASLQFFGLSALGVRLPSIVVGAMSAVLLFILLHRLMRPNTAVVMSVLAITSSWFVGAGRQGTPDIMIIFWTVTLLLLATLVSQNSPNKHLWKPLGLLALGLSLYTPYIGLLLVVAAISTLAQPHLRYLARYADTTGTTLSIVFLLVLLLPLGFTIGQDPKVIFTLLSIPATLPGPLAFVMNIGEALSSLFNPLVVSFNGLPQPLVAAPIAMLAVTSLYRLVTDWHSVRSHVLLVWVAVLLPLIGLHPADNLTALFVPVMLLAAIGLQEVIKYWYTIFPRNPYARIFGLLPLGLLVTVIIQFNYQRYFLALPYAQSVLTLYNQDPFLLTNAIDSKIYQNQHVMLVVPNNGVELYSINQAMLHGLTVVSNENFAAINNATTVIVAENIDSSLTTAQRALLPGATPRFLVTDRAEDALRFRMYSSL